MNTLTLYDLSEADRDVQDYSDDIDDSVVSDSIHAIGCCASTIPESTQQCLAALINMIHNGNGA
jgi:AP-3 complex subunit beta